MEKNKFYGLIALREIRAYQKTTELLIPAAPYNRLIKEVLRACGPGISKIQAKAVLALREAGEAYLVGLFEDVNAATIHAGHVTIGVKDLSLAQRLRGENQ
ncbi:histone-fold-containing protein [Dunaliella salina]|uniref:Histone-fold-containing protein n=1 Tax=Dunaliella salina TaxID=3046 RepID=A0ABQ7GR42_DUNSA|nr:histone-fold-containing protein [Dunaliella salina]|eukprot:KAF5837085.1 histone-fold-containing protein [Dunaliella salina]